MCLGLGASAHRRVHFLLLPYFLGMGSESGWFCSLLTLTPRTTLTKASRTAMHSESSLMPTPIQDPGT